MRRSGGSAERGWRLSTRSAVPNALQRPLTTPLPLPPTTTIVHTETFIGGLEHVTLYDEQVRVHHFHIHQRHCIHDHQHRIIDARVPVRPIPYTITTLLVAAPSPSITSTVHHINTTPLSANATRGAPPLRERPCPRYYRVHCAAIA